MGIDLKGHVDARGVGADQAGGVSDGSAARAMEIAGFEFNFHWQINAVHQ